MVHIAIWPLVGTEARTTAVAITGANASSLPGLIYLGCK